MATEIKQMSHENDKTPLDQVADVLLYREEHSDIQRQNEQAKYKLSYKRIEGQLLGGDHDSANTTSIETSILKICFNNLVRPVWVGPVINVQHSNYEKLPSFVQQALPNPSNETSTTYSSSGLAFPLMLGNTISKLQNEAETLQQQKQQLTSNTLRWKNTVDKLTGQWQREKLELTQNFLTLFNQHKARHMETLQKLEAFTKHGSNDTAAIGTLSNKQLRRNEKEAIPDDEDNHDYAVWDKDMVDRMAAGPEGRRKMGKLKVEREDDIDRELKSTSLDDAFRNPITGVMMCTDHKRLFDSDDEEVDEVSSAKKRKS
jgi:hypothetical protein